MVRAIAKLREVQPPPFLSRVLFGPKQIDLPIPIISAPAQVPRLHVSNLDKVFPLTEAPLCLHCKEPTQREEVQSQGFNHGRWRYTCQACFKQYGRWKYDRSVSFCTWDDDVGIDVRNPMCRCDLPSREGHCGYGSRAPGKIFMTCAVGSALMNFGRAFGLMLLAALRRRCCLVPVPCCPQYSKRPVEELSQSYMTNSAFCTGFHFKYHRL